ALRSYADASAQPDNGYPLRNASTSVITAVLIASTSSGGATRPARVVAIKSAEALSGARHRIALRAARYSNAFAGTEQVCLGVIRRSASDRSISRSESA